MKHQQHGIADVCLDKRLVFHDFLGNFLGLRCVSQSESQSVGEVCKAVTENKELRALETVLEYL